MGIAHGDTVCFNGLHTIRVSIFKVVILGKLQFRIARIYFNLLSQLRLVDFSAYCGLGFAFVSEIGAVGNLLVNDVRGLRL